MVSFFYPLMWLAAAGVAAPLWLHLRRRDETDIVRFSAMRFLDDQPLARRRPRLPRDLPLLLLRVALLLLIVAAFAWPFRPTSTDVVVRESRVYVLDNTLSHQANNRFAAARDRLADTLAAAGADTQFAVVELTTAPRVLVQFGDDPAGAAVRVRQLEASHQRGSYAAAFRLAQQLLDEALGEQRRIVLLADSQQNQWQEDAAVPPFLGDVAVDLPAADTDQLPNVGLQPPLVRRVRLEDRQLLQAAVSLQRVGDAQPVQITVLLNGQPAWQQEVPWRGNTPQQTVALELEDQPERWLRGEIRLSAARDALAGDDRVFFSLPPLRRGRVAVLADSVYLRTVLSPAVLGDRWTLQEISLEAPSAADPADVLCLESQFLTSGTIRTLVLDYLGSGRGVMLFVGRDSPVVAGLLRDLGVRLLPEPSATAELAGFRYVYLEHPIFQPFRATDFGDLAHVQIGPHRRLEVEDAVPLAFSASGDPLLLESTRALGRLLVFAFLLDRSETNWPLQPTFLPFLDRCLQHLRAPDRELPSDFLPGESVVWQVPPDRQVRQLSLWRSDDEGTPVQRVEVAHGQARFFLPDAPGHYELRWDDRPDPQWLLNVNPPTAESQLTFASAEETLQHWRQMPDLNPRPPQQPSAVTDLARHEVLRQKYWWWLLAIGLLAMAVETAWVFRKQGLTS